MTKEDLEAALSMRDVLERYGIVPNHAGYICCPFHREKTASFKVYEKDYHCFGCGENGDIFDFVQKMEDVSFREAFQILGGTYERPTFSSRLAVYRSKKRWEMARKEQERKAERKRLNHTLISVYRGYLDRSEPLSDVWCDCYNALQYQLYLQEELNGREAG